jgi:1-acyl-sn-glycerol-3-phosphate acyltransferase
MKKFCRWILNLINWKVVGTENMIPFRQYVVIVASHTSNWDFPLGIVVRTAFDLQKIKFLGKSSLFKWPHGFLFRWLGGFPAERSKRSNLVQDCIELFKKNADLCIIISPEGTRKKVEKFKTGYYYIAKGANIPIFRCKFDYFQKIVSFDVPFFVGNDAAEDLKVIEDYFRGTPGKIPALSF